MKFVHVDKDGFIIDPKILESISEKLPLEVNYLTLYEIEAILLILEEVS